jgi:hypothetical protein
VLTSVAVFGAACEPSRIPAGNDAGCRAVTLGLVFTLSVPVEPS